jgi:sterol desaturase/sphingolipid hydroxylase (fatty acid hydroxylase superfamily)
MMNLYTQGLGVIIFIESMKLLDYRVIVLWAFLYATVHNINYMYLSPTTHRDHHIDSSTNYGIDTLDILFNTKYNNNDIEDLNHASINLIFITCVIIFFNI